MSFFERFYRPYRRNQSPSQCNFGGSKMENPLVRHYRIHLQRTREALAHVRALKWSGRIPTDESYAYFNRDWFINLCHDFDEIVDRVRIERIRSRAEITIGSLEHKAYLTWMALLEIACSLILFCEDPRYQSLKDGDVALMLFPVSRWTRGSVQQLYFKDNRLSIKTHF